MSANERPTDGPDTELAVLRAMDLLVEKYQSRETSTEVDSMQALAFGVVASQLAPLAARLRAVLARPAAGRDLTAQDVRDALSNSSISYGTSELVAEILNRIARPAVARTDAPCQGTCTGCGAGEDQVCAGSCRCVASGVHDRDGYTPDMPEYAPPADERAALVPSIERALFGTTDGDLLDDDSDVPVGELRRLLREVWATASDGPR